jgi:hypothetical protein
MRATTNIHGRRELARRCNDGIEVALHWHGGDVLTVEVTDTRSGRSFELPAPASKALDVYYHPFAHAADTFLEPALAV